MRTKKVFLVALLVTIGLVSVNSAKAQSGDDPADNNVTVNIKLHPIQSLVVTEGQRTVDIEYQTPEDYKNGKISEQQLDHLTVFSTGGFTISVKSDGNFVNAEGYSESIDAGDVQIVAEAGTDNDANDSYTNVDLSTDNQSLIISETGARERKYNITYNNEAGKDDKYLSYYNMSYGNPTVYTAQVTYSIEPK
ncbi:hypothetical protein [Limibacterium fermenti]|uniref:hypothetical protein n=1 Tax=Limibacterium fermenti TaxID=3229863 RepID=UPI003A5F1A6D